MYKINIIYAARFLIGKKFKIINNMTNEISLDDKIYLLLPKEDTESLSMSYHEIINQTPYVKEARVSYQNDGYRDMYGKWSPDTTLILNLTLSSIKEDEPSITELISNVDFMWHNNTEVPYVYLVHNG